MQPLSQGGGCAWPWAKDSQSFGLNTQSHGTNLRPPLGLGCTSADLSFAFFWYGLYSGSPMSTVIQLHISTVRE